MATQFDAFTSKLGISNPKRKGVGYSFAPFTVAQGQSTPGQELFEKIGGRKEAGQSIYSQNKSETTGRLGQDLINKSAGLELDEFGKPKLELANFSDIFQDRVKSIDQRGKLALQTEESKKAFSQAVDLQNVGSYGFGSYAGGTASGTDIPGATAGNKGAQAASMAMKAMKNHTPYVWGGNSLSRGVDCSGLVQQIYKQLGVNVPRTTYEQAKNGKQVSAANIRPGDLVFYRGRDHVGIYVGNGKIVHAANSKLGTIQSNLNNSNGSPSLILRPY
jgi:cell wall-associated NlpC family hydrolase